MKEKEIKELLDTIDILKYIAEMGKEEVRRFSHYMIVWGLYGFINVIITLLTKAYTLWFYTLPLAFFFSTIPVSGFFISLLIWGTLTFLWWLAILYKIQLFVISLLIGLTASLGYWLSYYIGIKRGKYKPYRLKIRIIPKIGWLWGFIMFGTLYIYFLLIKILGPEIIGKMTTILFAYATGIGLFASGIIIPFFFILGILEALGVPILYYLNPYLGYSVHGIVGLLMAIYGIYITRNRK